MDYSLFEKHTAYVRNALAWCAQGMYSKYEYLENIYYDAAGLLDKKRWTTPFLVITMFQIIKNSLTYMSTERI